MRCSRLIAVSQTPNGGLRKSISVADHASQGDFLVSRENRILANVVDDDVKSGFTVPKWYGIQFSMLRKCARGLSYIYYPCVHGDADHACGQTPGIYERNPDGVIIESEFRVLSREISSLGNMERFCGYIGRSFGGVGGFYLSRCLDNHLVHRSINLTLGSVHSIFGLDKRTGIDSRLLLHFTIGAVHEASLPEGDCAIEGSCKKSKSRPEDEFLLRLYKSPLIPLILVCSGTGGAIFIFRAQDDSGGNGPWYFAPVLMGCFLLNVIGGGLFLDRIFNRAKASEDCFKKLLNAAWESHKKNLFWGLIREDETRISRRPQGVGEFREVGEGCFSGTEGCGPEETAQTKAYTPQNDRQRQGLERFLLPRPCLRVVERVCILAGELGIREALACYLGHGQREAVSVIDRVIFCSAIVSH
jgi:hypothetical protein